MATRKDILFGFSLLEITVVICILTATVALVSPLYQSYTSDSSNAIMQANDKTLRTVLSEYRADKGRYPDTISELWLGSTRYLRAAPVDPEPDAIPDWGYKRIPASGNTPEYYTLGDKYEKLVSVATPTGIVASPTATPPGVALTSTSLNPVSAAFPVTITFDNAVTGFDFGDIVVSNGIKGNFSNSIPGKVWAAVITPTGAGTVTVDVAANAAKDSSTGVGNTAASPLYRTFIGAAPSVVLSTTAPNPVNAPFIVTISFGDFVTGFDATDISVANATKGSLTTVISGRVWTIPITPTTPGTITVDVAANAAINSFGTGNTSATQLSRAFDNVAPAVVLSSTASNPTNAPFIVTVAFNKDVTGFDASDIVVTNGTKGSLATMTPNQVWTIQITPTTPGTITVDVAANTANDSSGNGNSAATPLIRVFDNVAPTVALSTIASNPTNAAFDVTITFNKDVTGFDATDVVVTNGTKGSLTNTTPNRVWTMSIIPTTSGATVSVDVSANAAQDSIGNANTAATQLSRLFDNVAPTVALTTGAPDPTNAAFTVTVTFSEDVTGFDATDILVTNATKGVLTNTAPGRIWTIPITPTTPGASVTVDVAANSAQDLSGNANTAAIQLTRGFDNVGPSVTLTSVASSAINAPFTVTVTFSENVTGFDATDIVVANATKGSFTNTTPNQVWTILITPITSGMNVTVDVAANSAQDSAGNGNTAAAQLLTRMFVNVLPGTPVVNDGVAASSTTTTPVISWTPSTEGGSGIRRYEVAIGNTLGGTQIQDWTTVGNVTTASMTGLGLVNGTTYYASVRAVDNAGNVSLTGQGNGWLVDTIAPGVTLSTPAPNPASAAFTVTVAFSEAVTGFDISKIVVTNGNKSAFTNTVASQTWTVLITPVTSGTNVTVDVAAGVASDSAGNYNTAASTLTRGYDNVAPSVTLSTPASDPVNGAFTATIAFSEAVTGFDISKIVVTNGNKSAFTNTVASQTWTVLITPITIGTNVTVNVAAPAPRYSEGGTDSLARQFTGWFGSAVGPTVTLCTPAPNPASAPFTVTVAFSDTVTGFDISDITVGNGNKSALTNTVASKTWTVLITPVISGTNVTVDVAAGAANIPSVIDNTAASTLTRGYDNVLPTVALSTTAQDPTNAPFTVTVTFSEVVTGFDVSKITVGNATK
ncbi:MAG: fibronectin type III domain-containing protein, partial [Candidatus Riflebacteria bacterium]|nr:fibronectin type III domain-containing protein [Candidatus Riflebacteria bacterium]